MRVMTYNILNDSPQFKDLPKKNWADRRPHLLSVIQEAAIDILAIQEGRPNQVEDIQAALPQFGYYGIDSKGDNQGEQLGIYYNQQKLSKVDSGTFWLSQTPEVCSKDWGSTHPRICSYVQLEEVEKEQQIFLFNTHLDHKSEEARLEGMKLILDKMAEKRKAFPQAHLILTGDFNARPQTPTYQKVKSQAWLVDTYHHAQTKKNNVHYTFSGVDAVWTFLRLYLFMYYSAFMHKRLDHIFVSTHTNVKSYNIIDQTYQKFYPSDHLPVVVELAE